MFLRAAVHQGNREKALEWVGGEREKGRETRCTAATHSDRVPSWLRLKSAPEWTPTLPKANSAGPCRWQTAPCAYWRVWMKLRWGKHAAWILHVISLVFYSLKTSMTSRKEVQTGFLCVKESGARVNYLSCNTTLLFLNDIWLSGRRESY